MGFDRERNSLVNDIKKEKQKNQGKEGQGGSRG